MKAMLRERVALDRFGELLMRRVRDEAIGDWNRILDGTMTDERSKNVRAELVGSGLDRSQGALIRSVIPQIVDTTLHRFLEMLGEEDRLAMVVYAAGKEFPSLREASDDLPGELHSERGWIARFSKERRGETV